MKSHFHDRNFLSSYILVIVSACLLFMIVLTDRRDITSAAVVISAIVLFLTAIFLFTFVKTESVDNHFVSLFPVQNQINICRIASDLGIMGNAWFVTENGTTESRVVQFMPVTSYGGGLLEGDSFISGADGTGMKIFPAGTTLLLDLKKNFSLTIPDAIDDLLILIREIGEDLLEIAESVQAQKTGDGLAISLQNYLFIEGCREISSESPACCLMNPCPVCSLFGMIITESVNKPVMIERCRPDKKKNNVEILFTMTL